MITVVRIELAPDERRALASVLDGKVTRREATRKEIARWATRLVEQEAESLLRGWLGDVKKRDVVIEPEEPDRDERSSRWKSRPCTCPGGPVYIVERPGQWCPCSKTAKHKHCEHCGGWA